jgi:hypothetical protein
MLFFRPCGQCGKPFDYCGSCHPGRLYCSDVCSNAARVKSKRQAHAKYNARDTEEGREAHRLEEIERRARERMGDHRCAGEKTGVQLQASTVQDVVVEAANHGALVSSDCRPVLETGEPLGLDRNPQARAVEWALVAWPELLVTARRRQGTKATCPFCGRQGRIVRVVSLDYWRQRLRHGFDEEGCRRGNGSRDLGP